MITWIGGLGGTSELGRSRDCAGQQRILNHGFSP